MTQLQEPLPEPEHRKLARNHSAKVLIWKKGFDAGLEVQ